MSECHKNLFRISLEPGTGLRIGGRALGSLMGRRADSFRQNAEQCRRLAQDSRDPVQRETWLKLAEEWTKMAAEADIASQASASPGSPRMGR